MNECGGRKVVVAGGKARMGEKGKNSNSVRGPVGPRAFQILSHNKIAKLHQVRCNSCRNTTSTE